MQGLVAPAVESVQTVQFDDFDNLKNGYILLHMFMKVYRWAEERYQLKKENVIPLVISVVFTFVMLVDSSLFHNKIQLVLWAMAVMLLILLVAGVVLAAGFTVLRSLFLLGAELSLLIFLGQSYCGVTSRTLVGDNALISLISISLIYIVFGFTKSLYKAMVETLNRDKDKKWPWEKIIIVIMFLFFTGMFVWTIHQVVSPIIMDLCVYKAAV